MQLAVEQPRQGRRIRRPAAAGWTWPATISWPAAFPCRTRRLRTGNLVALLAFKSGIEKVFDVQVLPGLRRLLISGPFAGQDGTEVIWPVPQPNG